MSRYTEGCPLDHSTYEKFTQCDCNYATAQEVWDFKDIKINKLKALLQEVINESRYNRPSYYYKIKTFMAGLK